MRHLWLAAVVFLLLAPGARAISTARTEHVKIAFIADKRAAAPGDTVTIAITEEIIPEWHTYWINPGDSGIAPTLSWTLPSGFTAGAILWPAPRRLAYGPLVNFGYSNRATLLADIQVPQTAVVGSTASLAATFNWLVCQEECIPESAHLDVPMPIAASSIGDPERADLFREARAALPEPAPFSAALRPTPATMMLDIAADKPADALFFPYKGGLIDGSAPQVLQRTESGFTLSMVRGELRGPLASFDGVVEIFSSPVAMHAYALSPKVPAIPASMPVPAAPKSSITIPGAALLAILGGMVLNLMPCVFPVLSLKLLGLVHHAGGSRRQAGAGSLAYTLGILCAFAAIAFILLAVKAAGGAVGWGFQLQSPGFVLCLAYLLFAMALSMSGMFEISGGFTGIGSRLAGKAGVTGSFFTGVLAALVATPCSAPFMGTAIGFAVTQPWPVATAIIECLGVGMALPFLVLSLTPALVRRLPRPGAWMDRFKQILAFPLYGSAVWLVWVLSLEAGPPGVLTALGGGVLIAFGIWLITASRGAGSGARTVLTMLATLAFVAALAGIGAPTLAPEKEDQAANSFIPEGWEPFGTARLDDLRRVGTPVFIDMSAAWCLTCILNERVALGPHTVAQLKSQGVVLLKGDWTNQDAEITAFLGEFGRDGVPLYVFYPGGDKPPVVLPQILTAERVAKLVAGN